MQRGLAELHLHLYGTIRAADYLTYLADREVDWGWYEAGMVAAYGTHPPLREVLERHRAGDAAAAAAFEELFVFGDADAGNFDRFQAKFNLLTAGSELAALMTSDDPAAFDRLRAEVGYFLEAIRADQIAQGIGHAEQRLLVGGALKGDGARAILEDVLTAYSASDGTITQRLAIGLSRRDPWRLWEQTTELALGPTGDALTGIDFCFIEEGHPPKDKAEFFAAVHDFNDRHPGRALAILYHVGESFRDKSLESSVRWVQQAAELGAHRLGHAIALGVDPDCYGEHNRTESVAERLDQIDYDIAQADGLARHGVPVDVIALAGERQRLATMDADDTVTHHYDAPRLDEVRRRQDYAMDRVTAAGAVVEVCPTSNRRIGDIADPAHHPVTRFLERGVPIVVGSDDPGIFGTTLSDELDWVTTVAGLDDGGRRELEDAAWRYRSEVMVGRVDA